MPRNGSGVYSLPAAAGNPVISLTPVKSSWANPTLTDIAAALTQSLSSDGQTAMGGQLNLANNKIINLANATNAQDAVPFGQYSTGQGATGTWNISVTGSSGSFAGLVDVTKGGTGLTILPTGQLLFGGVNTPTIATTVSSSPNLFWDNIAGQLGVGTNSPQVRLHVAGATRIQQAYEAVTIDSTTVPSGTYNFDINNGAIVYFTQAPTANVTINLRGNATTPYSIASLNNHASTFVVVLNNGATPFFISGFMIDGVNQSVRYAGGASPAAGNANSSDVYTYTVIDQGTTYAVIANLTQYA